VSFDKLALAPLAFIVASADGWALLSLACPSVGMALVVELLGWSAAASVEE